MNIAARLGGLAQGGDVILSHAALADPATCALAGQLGDLLPLAAQLRGLPDHFDLYRLVVARKGDKSAQPHALDTSLDPAALPHPA